jgi:ribonuclease VapC
VESFVIFVDSSAVVAILTADPDAATLTAKLEGDAERISAGHVILEASIRLANLLGLTPAAADGLITRLLREAAIAIVPISEEIGHAAVAAFDRYGRGRSAAGTLNFGDCLSYACAKAHSARLLFKGHDFTQTDIFAA